MIASTLCEIFLDNDANKLNFDLLKCFSMISNGRKIFKCRKNNKSTDIIECIHGIRVLSIIWIVYSHSYLGLSGIPHMNSIYSFQWVKNILSMILYNGSVAVDTFFLISGLLLSWNILKHLDVK